MKPEHIDSPGGMELSAAASSVSSAASTAVSSASAASFASSDLDLVEKGSARSEHFARRLGFVTKAALVLFGVLLSGAWMATDSLAAPAGRTSTLMGPSPLSTVLMLGAMGLAALAFLMVSSFVKIAVVLSILRSALGLSQIPPTSVITGIALLLSIYVMAPTGRAMSKDIGTALELLQSPAAGGGMPASERVGEAITALSRAKEPIRKFLARHAHKEDVRLFVRLSLRMDPTLKPGQVTPKSLMVLLPAFVTSELKEAFQIGFLLFVPFLIIDLLVANVLMALGMHMLSPTTISLPFKLLLFVMVDGWHLLTRALLTSYV